MSGESPRPQRTATAAGRLVFALAALPAIARAAARARGAVAAVGLRELPDRLRAVPLFRAPWLRRPADLDGVVARLLPWLPPRRTGRCLKRSLLLLDLWSRCGLAPRLHLGVRLPGEGFLEGHAWVTTGDADLDLRTGPEGHEEMWSG